MMGKRLKGYLVPRTSRKLKPHGFCCTTGTVRLRRKAPSVDKKAAQRQLSHPTNRNGNTGKPLGCRRFPMAPHSGVHPIHVHDWQTETSLPVQGQRRDKQAFVDLDHTSYSAVRRWPAHPRSPHRDQRKKHGAPWAAPRASLLTREHKGPSGARGVLPLPLVLTTLV